MSSTFRLILSVFICSLILMFASCKSRGPHNEYLDSKKRVSERESAKNKKHIKKGNRAYAKQLRKNRRFLFGTSKGSKG